MMKVNEENFEEYILKAESGDVSAMNSLGVYYELNSKPVDYEQAVFWYEKAAGLNNIVAIYNFGRCYKHGRGRPVDLERAFSLFKEAADAGYNHAQFQVAICYGQGGGVETDQEKAFYYYGLAAAQNNKQAMLNLARRLRAGTGCAKNTKESNKLLNELNELNYPEAINYMAYCYDFSIGYRRNYKKSFSLYQKAATLGHVPSIFEVAKCYAGGFGVETNEDKSQEYYQIAHDKGHLKAKYYITPPAIKQAKSSLVNLGVDEGKADAIQKALVELEETFFTIREAHTLDGSYEIGHFTSWGALESILPLNPPSQNEKKLNHLRLYNVAYMNDPMEGMRLLKRHETDEVSDRARWVSKILSDAFDRGYYCHFINDNAVKHLLPSVYTVSFTESIDRLDLWRAYGNDGAGYCITVPVNVKKDPLARRRHRISNVSFTGDDTSAGLTSEDDSVPWLYRIKYDDKSVDKALEALYAPLRKIQNLIADLDVNAYGVAISTVAAILIELLYLYKDEQYSSEKEIRSLITLRMGDPSLDVDSASGRVGRVFCRTGNFLFKSAGAKIIIGPKVANSVDSLWNLRFRLQRNSFSDSTAVVKSRVLYR